MVDRKGRVRGRVLALLLVGLAAAAAGGRAADAWPNCGFNCTAGDVTLASVYVVVPSGACEPGGTSTAHVYGRFSASARRYAIILIGDLVVEGSATRRLASCAGDMAAGTTDILLATVTWPCGSAVSLRNVIVSWSANPESCTDASCAGRSAKCSASPDVVVSTPLVVDFSTNSPQCLGSAMSFSNLTAGGSAPLSISWAFGDGATSAQEDPSHAYAAPGTYRVTLTVRDRTGATDSHTRSVVVSPIPTATAGNGGPYCPGAAISLVASGGTSYAWTGPDGFTSSAASPTIPAASSLQAGMYTVRVTNAAGCSAQASTTVVVDVAPPVLTLPDPVTVPCGYPTDPAATGRATATDNSGALPTIAHQDLVRLGGCGGTGTITRTWTATDACGNSASGTQTISVVDVTPPRLVVPDDLRIECGQSTLPAATGGATATDGCTGAAVSYADEAVLSECGGTGVIRRVWTAIDDCGNQSSGIQTLTVVDSLAPALSLPADVRVACGQPTDPAATGHATATDGCSAAQITFSDDVQLSECGGSGVVRRTWTAADACGHSVMGVQTITVADDGPPALTAPADVTVECGHSTAPSATGLATATDGCSAPLVSYADDVRLNGCAGTGTILRIWTATDACGHATTKTQTITVADTRPPVLTVPADGTIRVGEADLPPATGEALASDACSTTTVTYADVRSLSAEGTGSIARTWAAVDACGHRATAVQTIAVVSAPPPPTLQLVVPSDVVVEAGDATDPTATGTAIATSTCPTPPRLTYRDVESLGGCDGTGVIFRSWSASDGCGNEASGVQTITVADTGGVLLTVPDDVTLEAEAPRDPSITGWAVGSDPDSDEPPAVTYEDDADLTGCDGTGRIRRTWTATDECGNRVRAIQIITVIDSGHLELLVPNDVTVQAGESTDPDATGWATASDPDAVEEPPSVLYSDAASLSGCDGTGTIRRTWTATDACGNVTSAIQMLTIVDTLAPLLTVPSDLTIETVDSRDPSFTGWAAVGHHDPDHAPVLAYSDAADLTGCDGTGTVLRTWTATDACGNVASGLQTIVVVDSGHVSLLIPPDALVECGHSCDPAATGWATASDPDAIYEAPEVSYVDSFEPSGCGGTGVIRRTWTGADECGNSTSALQTITILDTTPPQLQAPADATVELGGSIAPAATGRAAASDACSSVTLAHEDVEQPGPCPGPSILQRTWTATDACGNASSAIQTIVLDDTTAPTLIVPADLIVECGHSTDPAATGYAAAADSSGTGAVAYADRETPAGCGGARTIFRTWTATDSCGNVSSGTQAIFVIDLTPPELTLPPDVAVLSGQSLLPIHVGQAAATDVCSTPSISYADESSLAADGSGTILRTWTAADACGNSARGVQAIAVSASPLPPQLRLTAPGDVTVDAGTPLDPSATGMAVAAGDCPGGASVIYEDRGDLNGCDRTGVLERTWTAADACGNRVSAVQRIIVLDAGAVRLVVPSDVTVGCGDSLDPAATGAATAYDPDAADVQPAVTYADVTALDPCSGAGVVQRTWTAMDACGHSVSAVQTIAVSGSCAPRVIISEIAWAGTAADPSDEWIELRNLGDDPVDLEGWTLRWRLAKPEPGEDAAWKVLPLAGTLGPASRAHLLPFAPNPRDPGTWWVDLSARWAENDFLLLERGDDDTVLDVPAGLVYDDRPDGARTLELSDRGEVMELVSSSGCVVDTANAERRGIGGWAAGDVGTRGTMERTDPERRDVASNWHTNLGVITFGEDAGGVSLFATPRSENEPRLAEFSALAAGDGVLMGAGGSVTIPLPAGAALDSREPMRFLALHAGEGRPLSLPLAVSGEGSAIELRLLAALPGGTYDVWIRLGGAALLVSVRAPS